jgi:hypothetical protein
VDDVKLVMCGSEDGGNTRREKPPTNRYGFPLSDSNLAARMISLISMQIYHLNCSRAHRRMKKRKLKFNFDADNLLQIAPTLSQRRRVDCRSIHLPISVYTNTAGECKRRGGFGKIRRQDYRFG